MVIASIDIQGGRVVQLKQGSQLVLERDNAEELAKEFDRYGEVAVIDLDAAMGRGNNIEMIKPLLRKAECRIGGGIKTPQAARELISLGAQKLIIGSQAFRLSSPGGGAGFGLNREFLGALEKQIGRERIIIAVDAKKMPGPAGDGGRYEIVVDGWKTPTGLPLAETAAEAASYASELLFTCVDREGTMTGMDLAPVRRLKTALGENCRLTVAGGVSSLAELETLGSLGCDVQLGMALYTGAVSLDSAFIRSLNWKKLNQGAAGPGPLIPVIAQSAGGQVLMTGYADHTALAESFARGNLCFYSRTRKRLWMKGEHSGRTLRILRLRADCDRDAVLAVVEPAGPVCHTGAWSCFSLSRRYTWEYLQEIIAERFRNPLPGSYTATLDGELVREKIMEEAEELCGAKTQKDLVWEAADLLYFATALLTREGVGVEEVLDELDRRHKK
ncbi:MAG: phosphoribosyl-ATP diphosphatase [Spirochaetaceae bacterium]|jgi:phosphoribosyl-ATP pyrophosphohydrolase/phosphoribosyl-AMP cyclohydrolase|nr:phosphoribosyl-ATP diphosphatase [Spirochaetaceae bacterium]